jgi:transmembrane sensor
MNNDNSLIQSLFEKYKGGSASPEEIKQLFNLVSTSEFDDEIKELLSAELQDTGLQDHYDRDRWNKVFNKVKAETELIEFSVKPKFNTRAKRFAIAASIAACLAAGFYFYQQYRVKPESNQTAQNDILPGKNGATLTLSNGRRIILSAANAGVLAKEAGVNIKKTANGKIVYEVEGGDKNNPDKINTLSTGNGETYQIELPDGSRVWLNDVSALTYPTSFAATGNRRVQLTGEAYFEVAKDKAHPFQVVTAKQTVTVLGTHFNINAYQDEPAVKTTLLEGSVQVAAVNGSTVKIKPGEQAVLKTDNLQVSPADIESAVAWKNGDFIFKDEGLETAMLRVARWYNVKIVYDASAPKSLELGGWVSRSRNISAVLNMMASTGEVHFKVEGRRVLVTK